MTVAQLSALNERELIEVLSRVFGAFAQQFDASGDIGQRYALARSSFEKGRGQGTVCSLPGCAERDVLAAIER